MRFSSLLVISSALVLDPVQCSAVVSDLGLISRTNNERSDTLIGLKSKPSENSIASKSSSHQPVPKTISPKLSDALSLWKVRFSLGVVIIAIAVALVIVGINTARVFGFISDPSEENARLVAAQKEAHQTAEEDPESLTKLLQSHTMRSYGSLFSNALARIQTSPRRNPTGASSSTEDLIIR